MWISVMNTGFSLAPLFRHSVGFDRFDELLDAALAAATRLAEAEARVTSAGYAPHSHADYEPGKRFYFDGPDGIEFELVQYG